MTENRIEKAVADAAKKILGKALAKQQCNALRLHTQSSCCGRSLQFELAVLGAEERTEMINGLSVLMDDESQQPPFWGNLWGHQAGGGILHWVF